MVIDGWRNVNGDLELKRINYDYSYIKWLQKRGESK
jgi:hypothetical protein